MYTASNMLSKARGNFFIKEKGDNRFYRNVYLTSEHWKNLRKEKLEKQSKCERCGTALSLDVHHENYRGLYDVTLEDLHVFCRVCHNKEHHKKKKKKNNTSRLIKREEEMRRRYEENNSRLIEDIKQTIGNRIPTLDLIRSCLSNKMRSLYPDDKMRKERINKAIEYKFREINNYVSIHY